jgi:UDP-N-acetylglucosamine acyltransferase
LKDAYRLICRENLSTTQALERIRGELQPCPELDHLLRFIESSERGITK